MRLIPYAVALGLVLAILVLGVRPATAQGSLQSGGVLFGYVYGFTMYDQLIPLEWVTVTATGGGYHFATSTGTGGNFEMFLPVGAYNVSISQPGYKPYSSTVAISDGSSSTVNFYLEESGVPIPEFPASTVSMIVVIVLAVTLLTRKATKLRHENQ
jgi:hypothetical protein